MWLRLCAPSETPAATVGNGFALEWGILWAGAAQGIHRVRLGRSEVHRCALGQVCVTVDPTNRPVSYLYLVIICWNEAPDSGRNGRRNRWTDLTEISSCFKNSTK